MTLCDVTPHLLPTFLADLLERKLRTPRGVLLSVALAIAIALAIASPAFADGPELVDPGTPMAGQPPTVPTGSPDTPADFDWDGIVDSLQFLQPDANNGPGWYIIYGGVNTGFERFEPAWTLAATEHFTWNNSGAGYLVGDSDGDGHPVPERASTHCIWWFNADRDSAVRCGPCVEGQPARRLPGLI
jgi:hypothetical protein